MNSFFSVSHYFPSSILSSCPLLTPSPLEQQMKEIARDCLVQDLTHQQVRELKMAFKMTDSWSVKGKRVKKILQALPKLCLEKMIDELLKNSQASEMAQYLESYPQLFDQESLLELAGFENFSDCIQWFKSRGLTKNFVLKKELGKEGKLMFQEFLVEVHYFFHHVLEMLVALLGLNEIGAQKQHRFSHWDQMDSHQALYRLEAYGKLLGYPALCFGFF